MTGTVILSAEHTLTQFCSWEYIVEFDDKDHTKLTANLIAESMYAQCDPDRNQYLLLANIVDHRANDSAVQLANQKVVRADGRTYLR